MATSKHTTLSRRAALLGGASAIALAGTAALAAPAEEYEIRIHPAGLKYMGERPDTAIAATYAIWDAARSVLQRHEEGETGLDVATAAETYRATGYEMARLVPETCMDVHRVLMAALNLNVHQYGHPDGPQAQGPHFDIIASAAIVMERYGDRRIGGAL